MTQTYLLFAHFSQLKKTLQLRHNRVPKNVIKINFRVILLFNFHGLAHNFSNLIQNSVFFPKSEEPIYIQLATSIT